MKNPWKTMPEQTIYCTTFAIEFSRLNADSMNEANRPRGDRDVVIKAMHDACERSACMAHALALAAIRYYRDTFPADVN